MTTSSLRVSLLPFYLYKWMIINTFHRLLMVHSFCSLQVVSSAPRSVSSVTMTARRVPCAVTIAIQTACASWSARHPPISTCPTRHRQSRVTAGTATASVSNAWVVPVALTARDVDNTRSTSPLYWNMVDRTYWLATTLTSMTRYLDWLWGGGVKM